MNKTRHLHKGPKAKMETLENVPLVAMTKQEFNDTFDELGKPLDKAMLSAARAGKDQTIDIVAIILHCAGQPDRLVSCSCEYGDGEYLRMEEDQMRRTRQFLEPGETLSLRRYRINPPWEELAGESHA